MLMVWHRTKGYIAGGIAFIACPCHLPITLPLLLALTTGTALGPWLQANVRLLSGLSMVVFVGGLFLAHRWIGETKPAVSARLTLSNRTPLNGVSPCASCEEHKTLEGAGDRPIREIV